MPQFIELNPQNPQKHKVAKIVDALKDGNIIVYPTDTVYGLGCDLNNKKAVERICKIKNIRPNKLNLSFICRDFSEVAEYTRSIPNSIFKVMKKALPGPFTFILEAGTHVPKVLGVKKKHVGIRMPNHPIPLDIVTQLGSPLITASLKIEDDILEYLTEPEDIYGEFKYKVDIIVNGGIGGIHPSTVVDCTNGELEVIRESIWSLDEFL